MTRKDYVRLAEVLRETRAMDFGSGLRDRGIADEVLDEITARLCEMLKADNPRFDRERFEAAADADRRELAALTEGEDAA